MGNHGERTEPQQRLGKGNHGKSVTMLKFSPYPERGQGSLLERAQNVAGSSNLGSHGSQ